MDSNIKIINIDGLPGITLQGIQGIKGTRGNITYTNYVNVDVSAYCIYDLWLIDNESDTPYIQNIGNYNNSDILIEGDYLLYTQSGTVNLYRVEKYVLNEDISNFSTNIISESYLQKVKQYYISQYIHSDIFLGKLLDIWKYDTNNVSVVANTKNIPIKVWTGQINEQSGKYLSFNISNEFLYFDVLSLSDKNLNNIRVTAEFTKSYLNSAEMHSGLTQLWKNIDTLLDSSHPITRYPVGNPKYILWSVNYDDELMDNFEVILKDWNDGVNNTIFSSPNCIDKKLIEGYDISLYVYYQTSGHINKTYIGQFNIDTITTKEEYVRKEYDLQDSELFYLEDASAYKLTAYD